MRMFFILKQKLRQLVNADMAKIDDFKSLLYFYYNHCNIVVHFGFAAEGYYCSPDFINNFGKQLHFYHLKLSSIPVLSDDKILR